MPDAVVSGVASTPVRITARPFLSSTRRKIDQIAKEVGTKHRLPPAWLFVPGRDGNLRHAKPEFYYRILAETDWSIKRLARHLGRDHTTVCYGAMSHMRKNKLPPPRGKVWSRSPSKKAAYDAARAGRRARP